MQGLFFNLLTKHEENQEKMLDMRREAVTERLKWRRKGEDRSTQNILGYNKQFSVSDSVCKNTSPMTAVVCNI